VIHPGSKLAQYEIISALGKGGMREVCGPRVTLLRLLFVFTKQASKGQ